MAPTTKVLIFESSEAFCNDPNVDIPGSEQVLKANNASVEERPVGSRLDRSRRTKEQERLPGVRAGRRRCSVEYLELVPLDRLPLC